MSAAATQVDPSAFVHPIQFFRAAWPFGFATQTLILLVMQTIDGTLRFQRRRRWYWPFTKLLCSSGNRIPTNIPAANALVERAAKELGGIPITSTSEILFDLPILEFRPYRSFDTKQSSAVLIQLFAAADVPQNTKVTWPPGAPGVKLETIYSIGLRMIFDWRRYF